MPDINKDLLEAAKTKLSTVKLAADGSQDPNLPNTGYTSTFNPVMQQRFQGLWTPLLTALYNVPAQPMYNNTTETSYMTGNLTNEDLTLQETEAPKEVSWSSFKVQLGKGKAGASHKWTEEELIVKTNQAEMMAMTLQGDGGLPTPSNISVNVITSNIAQYLNSSCWNGDVPADGKNGIVGILTQHKKVNGNLPNSGIQNARYNRIAYADDSANRKLFWLNVRNRYLALRKLGVQKITLLVAEGNIQKMYQSYYVDYLGLSLLTQNYDSNNARLTQGIVELESWLDVMEIFGPGAGEVLLYPNQISGMSTYERYYFASKKSGMLELNTYIRTDRPQLAELAGFPGELIAPLNETGSGLVKIEMVTFPAFAFQGVGLGCYYDSVSFVAASAGATIDAVNDKLLQTNTSTVVLSNKLTF